MKDTDIKTRRAIRLYDGITGVSGDFVERASVPVRRRGRIWLRLAAAAACICLVLTGAFHVLQRLDYLGAGCGAWAGQIVNGVYYYAKPHSGVYSYAPDGESEKLLGTYWFDQYQLDDYGIYYTSGKRLYVREHTTGKRRHLYTAKKSTHIFIERLAEGNVMLTCYNKRTKMLYEVLVDGKNGKQLVELASPISYEASWHTQKYSELHDSAGERQFELIPTEEEYRFDLYENGKSILPKGVSVCHYNHYSLGDTLVLQGYEGRWKDILVVLPPKGGVTILSGVPTAILSGNEDYLFYADQETVYAVSLADGTKHRLKPKGETAVGFYEVVSDGAYLYACAPWKKTQECWQVDYLESVPVGLTLVKSDIGN